MKESRICRLFIVTLILGMATTVYAQNTVTETQRRLISKQQKEMSDHQRELDKATRAEMGSLFLKAADMTARHKRERTAAGLSPDPVYLLKSSNKAPKIDPREPQLILKQQREMLALNQEMQKHLATKAACNTQREKIAWQVQMDTLKSRSAIMSQRHKDEMQRLEQGK